MAKKQQTNASEATESAENVLSVLQQQLETRKAGIGQAQRQAQAHVASLQRQAHYEQSKWAYNGHKVERKRFHRAREANLAEDRAAKESHALLIAKLATLEARCTHHRQMNHHKEELHKRMLENLQKEAESDAKYREEAEDVLISMARPTCLDVDAFQFTRYHCQNENRFSSTKSTASVRVIRHHPSSNAWDTETETFQAQIDAQNKAVDDTAAKMRGQAAMQVLHGKLRDQHVSEWLREWDRQNRCDKLQTFESDAHGAHSIERAFENAFGFDAVSEISLGIEGDHYVEPGTSPFDSASFTESIKPYDCNPKRSNEHFHTTLSPPSERLTHSKSDLSEASSSRNSDMSSVAPSITQYSLPSSNSPDSKSLSESLEKLDISLHSASTFSEPSENLVDQLLPPLHSASPSCNESISSTRIANVIAREKERLELSSESVQSPTQYSIAWLDVSPTSEPIPSKVNASFSFEEDSNSSIADAVVLDRRRRRLMQLRKD
ncbi:hypothetical protein ABG067_006541 [Albugo candida]